MLEKIVSWFIRSRCYLLGSYLLEKRTFHTPEPFISELTAESVPIPFSVKEHREYFLPFSRNLKVQFPKWTRSN